MVNRGQRDIDTKKTITRSLEGERSFFENHPAYKSKAQYCGTPYLSRKLNMVSSTTSSLLSMLLLFIRSRHTNTRLDIYLI